VKGEGEAGEGRGGAGRGGGLEGMDEEWSSGWKVTHEGSRSSAGAWRGVGEGGVVLVLSEGWWW